MAPCPPPLSRRALVRSGLALGAFILPGALRAPAAMTTGRRRARGVILVLLEGGMSHLDTWDPKPGAPAEIRGPFQTIATSLPGLRVGEHLPLLARQAHLYNLLRSVHCEARNDHSPGLHVLLTGYEDTTVGVELKRLNDQHPSQGSAIARLQGATSRDGVPRFVAVPRRGQIGNRVAFTTPAFLGGAYEAFETGPPPATAHGPMTLPPSLRLARDLPLDRLGDRLFLRQLLGRLHASLDRPAARMDADYQQACEVLAGRRTRQALDLAREPAAVRERYGDGPMGQGLLLARRLVEAGVTYVLVNGAAGNDWDTHADNFNRLKHRLLPPMDRAVAALLADLDQRGLLDEVLVLVAGEMGRTPAVNAAAGRDHWTRAYSVLLAGGGLTRGQVLGGTTRDGGEVGHRPVAVPEVLATVYDRLGIDPNTVLHDGQGRPVPILPETRPVRELLA